MKIYKSYNLFTNCFIVDEQMENLFVGASDIILKQYSLKSKKMVKQYKNLKIGILVSLSIFKRLLCVRGSKGFALINLDSNEFVTENSLENISTSQFCIIEKKGELKVTLSVFMSK